MFFEIGVVLLVPIVLLVAQRSEGPLLRIGIPALAGLPSCTGWCHRTPVRWPPSATCTPTSG